MVVGYGKNIRNAVEQAKKKSSAIYKCPSCSRNSVERESSGIWKCRKCNVKFASGSYMFKQ